MARGWKKVVEGLLSRSGAAGFAERRRWPLTVILAYHNIVPAGESAVGDVSLHIDQATFGDQLDWLLERGRIVGLGDALAEGGDRDPSAGARIVITFDDAYRGTMTAGMEELSRRDLPSVVFVPTGLLGTEGFWWDRIAPVGGHPLDPAVRRHALQQLDGRTPEVLDWAGREGLPVQKLPAHARPVMAEELTDSLAEGVTLGAHTATHPNLTRLGRGEIRRELQASQDWLTRRTDRYRSWLAYPYGMMDDATASVAGDIFDAALLVDGGAAVVEGVRVGSRLRIPRVNVPRGLSLDGLALRLAGIR